MPKLGTIIEDMSGQQYVYLGEATKYNGGREICHLVSKKESNGMSEEILIIDNETFNKAIATLHGTLPWFKEKKL